MKRIKIFTEKTVASLLALMVVGLVVFSFIYNKPPSLPPPPDPSRPVFQKGSLKIIKKNGDELPYEVEMAVTPHQHMHGLKFLKEVPRGQGMIFLYDPPQEASFWMKNTLIPLDLIFVSEEGMIVKVAPNAKPHDLTPIPSDIPIRAVLEIGGGEAAALGIKVGDKMIF